MYLILLKTAITGSSYGCLMIFDPKTFSLVKAVLVLYFWIFSEPSVHTKTHDTEEGFGEDATAHLAGSLATIDEDDRYFLDFEANLEGRELHLNLERIAFETNHV